MPHDWTQRKDGADALNRSQLEAQWADRLERLDMEWEHEPDPLPG
ncbi:MAG: hypothetical protein OXK82_07560 [Deltaproteobacteria bacterium]|nr:hypothetical protein [Deltaproteobacteria bacterium]